MKGKESTRPRFRIGVKLLLLTAALSVALILVAVFTTYRLLTKQAENDVMQDCLKSANSTATLFQSNYLSFFQEYRSMIGEIYEENIAGIEQRIDPDASGEDGETRKAYFDSLIAHLFPPVGMFGATVENIERRLSYEASVQYLGLVSETNDAEDGFVFFYDAERGYLVHLVDAPSADPEKPDPYYPCAVELPSERMREKLLAGAVPAAFADGGLFYALAAVTDPETGETIAYVCYRQSTGQRMESVNDYTLSTLLLMISATLVLALFFLLFADLLIVRNIQKLADSAESFAEELESGEKPEIVPLGIGSGDEIGDLADKFGLMQNAIVGYAETLAGKTALEEKMNAELEVAARIQKEALPEGSQRFGDLLVESFLHPAKEVGGDFYDYFPLDENRLFFYVADVSGKGIPAALFMMRAKELIKAQAFEEADLSRMAYRINDALCRNNAEGIFITAFFGIYEKETRRLQFLRAGHEQPFLKAGSAVTRIAEESNLIMGVFEGTEFESGETVLEPGSVLLLFTDGLNEGINESEEQFGYERIGKVLAGCAEGVPERLYGALSAFAGSAEQFDDVTMLCLTLENRLTVRLDNPSYDDIPAVCDRVEAHFSSFDPECASELGIILDELLNNQVSYAFEGIADPFAELDFRESGGVLTLTLTDNGIPFDPLSGGTRDAEDPSLSGGGGNGIRLVTALSDSVRYERAGGANRLTLRKNMQKSKASAEAG